MRTDILGHPPSLCNCRRVWHPAIPTQPSRGCSGLHCTNQPRTAPTKLPLHPPTARDFCAFCAFCGITRTLTFCAFCAFCGRIRSRQVAWVWQGCHTLLSEFRGQYISARLVQQRLLHPLTFRAFRGRTPRTLTFCEFREFRGRTPRTLTFRACVPWENTHCLLVYPSLVYLKINDYGYVLGWRLQPKPIVLARHPSSRRGRPASHP